MLSFSRKNRFRFCTMILWSFRCILCW